MGEHRLKDMRLPMRLYQLVAPDLRQDFPAIKSLSTIPNNLPLQLTSFIGREKEIAEIKSLLKCGPPGHPHRFRRHRERRAWPKKQLRKCSPPSHKAYGWSSWPLTDPEQIIPLMAQTSACNRCLSSHRSPR